MNWKTTLILFLVCAGLGTWVYFDVRKAPQRDGNLAFPLVRISPDEITQVEIERAESTKDEAAKRMKIVFQRNGETWRMLEPLEDIAEATVASELAGKLTSTWPVAFLETDVDPAKLGIGPDSLRVTLTFPEGRAIVRFGLGFKAQHKFYAQVEGDTRVAVLSEDVTGPYLRPIEAYRRAKAVEKTAQ